MTFDNSMGKYDGPLSALCERWVLGGSLGQEWFSATESSEGATIWDDRNELTWTDARYLMREHDATLEEMDALAEELDGAQGIGHSWNDSGFLYARTYDSVRDREADKERLRDAYYPEDAEEEG